uniref:SRCR domain-containing protein n=1 Tax=Amphimedon queenslandica TaxID=400682 RepID=A0A1X7TQ46_AMPQE
SCEGDRLWDVKLTPLLRLYDGKRWKDICFDGEMMATAHVACRQQGYTNATSLIYFYMRSDQLVTCPTVSNYFLYGETNIMHCNMTYYGNPFYVFCLGLTIICSFDIYAKYLTSGSRSQCALDEDSHGALDNCSHCAGDEQNYYRSSRSSVFIQCPRIIDYSLLVLL